MRCQGAAKNSSTTDIRISGIVPRIVPGWQHWRSRGSTVRRGDDLKHIGSVTDIHGGKIAPVDIITFGSPCQDLSVAGKRAGLEGERSGLFNEAVRIIREMQSATANKSPRLAVWENVPGAFSSNNGKDFAAVLESLVGCPVCVPETGWTSAGVAFGSLGQAAWRTLDAQFHGVAQRRRRIFLIADFGGQRAGEILFELQSMSGDFEARRKAREEVAAYAGDGIEATDNTYGIDLKQITSKPNIGVDVMPTLLGNENAGPNQYVCGTFQNTGQGWWNESAIGATIRTPCGGDSVKVNLVSVGYAVRHLTPLECERLQGLPDGWTDIPSASDTARYKAIGNGLAIPCVEWLMKRIAAVLNLKTMGSLFDGIAGFPLAGRRAGIKTMWASEIEPFCIKVSQKHFPEVM